MRVFIVDSEPIFREGLKTIIRSKHEVIVAGEAGNWVKKKDLVNYPLPKTVADFLEKNLYF